MRWLRSRPLPAEVAHALDLAVDPQLVHDFAQTLEAQVGQKHLQLLRTVRAIRIHSLENRGGEFAQRLPWSVHSCMTAAAAFWLDSTPGRYNQGMPVTLSSRERSRLKARAHSLQPVVRIGQAGVTPELAAEVDRALTAHELIKVSLAVDDRDERYALGEALAEQVGGAAVHRVGKILILWRPRADDV